jgi:hypothetical protein
MKLTTLILCLAMSVAGYSQPEISVVQQTDCMMMDSLHFGQIHYFATMQPNTDSLRAQVMKVIGFDRVPIATHTSTFSIDETIDSVSPGIYFLRKEYFSLGNITMTYDSDTIHMNSCTGTGLGTIPEDDDDCTDTIAPLGFSVYNDFELRTDVYLVHGLDTVMSIETISALDTVIWTGDGFYNIYLYQYYDSTLLVASAMFDVPVKHCISTSIGERTTSDERLDFELVDMTGNLVRSGTFLARERVPNVSGLVSGMYIVRPLKKGVPLKPYTIVVEGR